MESEKIIEIKGKLQEEIFIANSFGDKLRKVPTKELQNLLVLIMELENENKRLQKDCADIANDYQEMAKFYDEKCEECDRVSRETAEKYLHKIIELLKEVRQYGAVPIGELVFMHEKNREIAKELGVDMGV